MHLYSSTTDFYPQGSVELGESVRHSVSEMLSDQHPPFRSIGNMSAIMDKVDADNFMDKVHADSFVKSNGKVETDGFDNIKLGFEDDTVDADSFVDSIELEFEDDPSRYKEFIRIMKAYRKSRLSDSEVVIRICELFVGYPSLVNEFNAFLPNGYFLVPSAIREEGDPYITLKTPEGETVYPRDYTRKPLASGTSSSSH